MPTVHLDNRALVSVAGADAEHFLQNILTTDLDKLSRGQAKPGALLTPQGKIMFDFLVSRAGADGFRLECRAEVADDFVRRLTLYRLRAKAVITKENQDTVAISWGSDSASLQIDSTTSQTGSSVRDSRFPADAAVIRTYSVLPPANVDGLAWDQTRIANGIAESGDDYALGDAFPHDVLLDETDGVGFGKGCYVGQEVVSRMHHRGTARRRVLIVKAAAALPPAGADITAGGRSIGSLGTSIGTDGLAIVRIDRVKDAVDAGQEILAGDVPVALTIPVWARFKFPAAPATAEGA